MAKKAVPFFTASQDLYRPLQRFFKKHGRIRESIVKNAKEALKLIDYISILPSGSIVKFSMLDNGESYIVSLYCKAQYPRAGCVAIF